MRVTATDLSGAAVHDDFTLEIAGRPGGRIIEGTCWRDYLVGTDYNDTIDGKESRDYMAGGKGDDTYYVDGDCVYWPGEWCDERHDGRHDGRHGDGHYGSKSRLVTSWFWGWEPDCGVDDVVEKADQGFDTVYSRASYTLAANVEALRLLGYADHDGTGNGLDNAIFGNSGRNTLAGGAGTDLLFGGAGADTLSDAQGNGLFDGGADNDALYGGAGRELFAGGSGDDCITTGKGADLIAFNRGDGRDIVLASSGRDNTVSLGNGIRYADLRFARSDKDLILITGANEQLTFKDWYAGSWMWGTDNRSVANLQIVTEGTGDYSAGSADKLAGSKIQQFDFAALVARFDAARTANPRLTSWSLAPSLAAAHLGGSDTAAIGGELAYEYARSGRLQDLPIPAAQRVLAAGEFGVARQALPAAAPLSAWGLTSSVVSFHVGAGAGPVLGGETALADHGGAAPLTMAALSAETGTRPTDPYWRGSLRRLGMAEL